MSEGENDEPNERSFPERVGEALGTLLVLPALLILFAAAVYAIVDAVVSDVPAPTNPGFIDAVLASDAVVAAVRIAVIFVAVYLVVSVVMLTVRGQWLTKVGPVEVSERVTGLVQENSELRNSLESASEIIEDLQDELRDTNELLEQVAGMVPDTAQEDQQ